MSLHYNPAKRESAPTFKCRVIWAEYGGFRLPQYEFDCPYCKRPHRHGALDGHRVAHCNSPDSPLRETGYWLEGTDVGAQASL